VCSAPDKAIHVVLSVEMKLHWGPQEVKDVSNVKCLLREAVSSVQSWPETLTTWATISKAEGTRFSKPLGAHIFTKVSIDTEHEI
jgi:hypothetical protein